LTSSKPAGRSVALTGVQSLAIARTFDGTMLETNTRTTSMDDLDSIFNNLDIVYISTHCYFKEQSQMELYVDLEENKHFCVLDLARIRTRADLIVFNACFSGQGSTTGGNDVLGFSYAMF
jgi:CHAT domain-containing protein